MPKMKINKVDEVMVISGKDRGKSGKVLRVDREGQRIVVEGVNFVKRNTRPNPSKNIQGGIVEREAPIHVSNVLVISPESGRPSRVGYTVLDDGRKVRVAKVDGAILDR